MSESNKFTYPQQLDFEKFSEVVQRLKRPIDPVDVVLDTDTFNEIDDQYAIAYLLQSCRLKQLNVKAFMAAPFLNHHSESAGDGMQKSYHEIIKVLKLMKREEYIPNVWKGASDFLPDEVTPVKSEASEKLIELSKGYTKENPLYVVCIAAPVNIASAILMDPGITERIVVIWSGGVSLGWPDCKCFNGGQNIAASRVVLDSNVPLVLIPGRAIGDRLLVSEPELEYWLRGKNEFCDYIIDKTIHEANIFSEGKVWSRPLTDVAPVAWLIDESYTLDRMEFRPNIEYSKYFSHDPRRPMMRYVYYVKRDLILDDLFKKLVQI